MATQADVKALLARQIKVEQELWERQCRERFLAWSIECLKPYGYLPARHHKLLIKKLEMIEHGVIDRLMIYMPPRHAKSFYTSRFFPPWFLARKPFRSIIAASHTIDLAEGFGRYIRNLTLDPKNKSILQFSLAPDSQAAGRWNTNAGGQYMAAGVGKAIAGNPADLAIIDDPVGKREEAESATQRDKVWDWYKTDLYTRLQPGARLILIMTRWHEDDLGGRLLDEMAVGGDQFDILDLPALAIDANDALGRKVNEPLWPEWMSAEALARIRKLDERNWWALYQQKPRPPEGAFFSVQSVLIDNMPVSYPVRPDIVYAVIDTAIKTGKKHDGTAVAYFSYTGNNRGTPIVILDWDIVQVGGDLLENWLPQVFDRLEELSRQVNARWGSKGVWIEDKTSGTILIAQAQRKELDAKAIDSALTAVGKDERAVSVSGYVAHGDVKLSEHAYNKTTVYKGRNGNHLLMQVFRFVLGVADQADDLLDTFCYGISIGLGDQQGY